MSKAKISELPVRYAISIIASYGTAKNGMMKLYNGQFKDILETTLIVGEMEVYEIISNEYKNNKNFIIDLFIDHIKELEVKPIVNLTKTKIHYQSLQSIIENIYKTGQKNAEKFLLESIMECNDYEIVIGDIHTKIEYLWNRKFRKKNPKHRTISIEDLI